MGRVAVVGDALIDELRDDGGRREFVGGAALNVAVGLSWLGVPSTLVAMVGDDEDGARVRAYLADFGVELIATPSPHGTARATSVRTGGGEPTYVFNEASQRRRIRFGAREAEAFAEAPIVVVSCMALDDEEQVAEFEAALAGARLAIDPNPRTGMMHDAGRFAAAFERLARQSALVKVGDDDARLLYQDSIDALRERVVGWGALAVLATAGGAGASLESGDVVVRRPISQLPGRIVDTMGAGDAAFAAVIAGLIDDVPRGSAEWDALLGEAMDAAAATCRFEGALLRLPSALADLDLDRIGT